MYYNVSQLMREPVGSTRSYELDDTTLLDDSDQRLQVAGKVRLLRTDKGIWVKAELDSAVDCDCSRCLKEVCQPIHLSLEEEFYPEFDVTTGTSLRSGNGYQEEFYINQSHHLDLTEAIRQYVSMNIPMSPLCEENCRGMCMECGADLNLTQCRCDAEPGDPRWGALLGLAPVIETES